MRVWKLWEEARWRRRKLRRGGVREWRTGRETGRRNHTSRRGREESVAHLAEKVVGDGTARFWRIMAREARRGLLEHGEASARSGELGGLLLGRKKERRLRGEERNEGGEEEEAGVTGGQGRGPGHRRQGLHAAWRGAGRVARAT